MKFGVVFGGGSHQRQLFCHPMGRGRVEISAVVKRLGVLPIFGSTDEAVAQSVWFSKSEPASAWRRGEFDETEAPRKGAKECTSGGVPVRGAKECNDKINHECAYNPEAVTSWKGWTAPQIGNCIIVRDKRSNTRVGKVLWAGIHTPGKNGIPRGCVLSNGWNYLNVKERELLAISRILNSPLADTAVRSIGSKRNINPKDLITLGLPKISEEILALLSKRDLSFAETNAIIFLGLFQLNNKEAEKLLRACGWVSKKETAEILKAMSLSPADEATKLLKAQPKKRGQIKKAAKSMGRR